ncbi:PHD finger protein At1g33420 isoform X2 [Nymphaea colorata]|uniref:PHD finger protein At1g33420 isoform X2 n=1 Tax=Nymphaea colorata TaxID=210225 RepID=UPI00129D5929|nr:PHD finger protein At1g33420 isoform X2 [Nymphaea colorata]
MVVNNPRPCKRLKRRVTAELFDLRGFPPPGFADLYGPAPFRTSIRSFLSRFVGSPQTPASLLPSPNLRAWQIVFQVGGGEIDGGAAAVTLNVVEEDVSLSRSVYCDHCRVVGWSSHPVCNTRYHFIIRADNSSLDGYPQTCTGCGSCLPSLNSRKVSVMDVSKKYGLEFRLLNAVAKGRPWYGNWGYEFGAGSFAISIDSYFQAVRAISSIPLEPFLVEERSRRTPLYDIIFFYSSLSTSPLSTLQDLVLYIMTLVHEARSQSSTASKKPVGTELSRWRADDLSQIERALMKVLQVATTSSWVSYKSLGGAISRARDPELVDFCLKRLPGRTVGDKVVCSQFNPATKTLEYRLQARDIVLGKSESCVTAVPSEEHLLHDLRYVYESLVHPQTMMNYRPLETRALAMDSARKLLDCKQFVKSFEAEYRKEQHCNPFITTLLCKVELIDQPEGFISPPPELINLPKSATLSDLKLEITKCFRDVYIFFRQFQVEELPDFRHIDDSSQLSLHCSSLKTPIVARGRCPVNRSFFQFIMERGTDSWTVDCQCGAQDDDGERMLACDVCGVWQHTRCVGIPDFEEEPTKFVCKKCGGCHKRSLGGGSCKQTARPRAKLEGLSISKVR